jgi:hypothetical protein
VVFFQVWPDCVQEDGAHDPEVSVGHSGVMVKAAQVEKVLFRLRRMEWTLLVDLTCKNNSRPAHMQIYLDNKYIF